MQKQIPFSLVMIYLMTTTIVLLSLKNFLLYLLTILRCANTFSEE